jgi:hypothetical protein
VLAVVALHRRLALEGLGDRLRQFHEVRVVAVEVRVGQQVGQVGPEEVDGQEERAAVRGVLVELFDRAGGEVVLEGRLDRLVEPCGEQVARVAVGCGAAHVIGDPVRRQPPFLQVGQVVGVVDGVVPAGQVRPVESVRGGVAVRAPVPLADQAQLVAALPQGAREGERVLAQVLQIPHVAFVVGQQPVAEGRLPREEAGPCRGADGGGRVGAVEARAGRGQPVEVGGGDMRVAVAAQGVDAMLVGHQEQQIHFAYAFE